MGEECLIDTIREQHASQFTPTYQDSTRTTTSVESDALVKEIQHKTQPVDEILPKPELPSENASDYNPAIAF